MMNTRIKTILRQFCKIHRGKTQRLHELLWMRRVGIIKMDYWSDRQKERIRL